MTLWSQTRQDSTAIAEFKIGPNSWMVLYQKEIYYEEVCMLKVFNSLGMRHTCCGGKHLVYTQACRRGRTMIQGENFELEFS
jgi:hypothetical protein